MMTWSGLFFCNPSSVLMESIILFHDYILIFLISIFFLVSFLITLSFFSDDFNSFFSHQNFLEILWTMIPFFILIFIVLSSLKSLYILDSCIFCGFTIFILAHQWYWSYFYKDFPDFNFDSFMSLFDSNSFLRLLEVDNRLILPFLTPIRFLCSSQDVIHSWSVPSLGIKMDSIPGRINQFCVSLMKPGVFYGQCSEICGINHSFMPISLESVSCKDFLVLMS